MASDFFIIDLSIIFPTMISPFKNKRIIRFSEVDPKERTDHCVLIVGYESDDGVDYWLCQNNYGTSHGDGGYFKIERNVKNPNGTANIAKSCFYPVIKGHSVAILE